MNTRVGYGRRRTEANAARSRHDGGQVGKGAEKAGSFPRVVRERQGYGLSRDNERPHKADRNARQTNPSVVH